ncbi:MAG: glycosyltransferase family 4 protein [Anaerolineales bacterium]|nr:glycosyltransferase family 4 protein [Anaerolineales bacterium]
MTLPLVLVSSQVKNFDQYYDDLVRDLAPRVDYMEICKRLSGEVAGYGLFKTYWYALGRKFEKIVKLDFFESLQITRRISNYNAILSASEKTAIPLAMLLSLSKNNIPHVVISHHLSSKNKSTLFKYWHLYKSFNHVICVSKAQVEYAVQQLNIPASNAHFVYDKVDHQFFRPMEDDTDDFIIAVGQEQRDYKTLQKAIAGTGIRLIVVASSHWSTYRLPILGENNTQIVRNIPYTLLRSLYARARLVVTPLNNVNYAAGANAILETMAMGKPAVVTRTPGIKEYVVDGETGLFVTPGDATHLRETILSLWDDTHTQQRLGTNARQAVYEQMNLDIYVNQITSIMERTLKETG